MKEKISSKKEELVQDSEKEIDKSKVEPHKVVFDSTKDSPVIKFKDRKENEEEAIDTSKTTTMNEFVDEKQIKEEKKLRNRLKHYSVSTLDLVFMLRHLALILKSGLPIGEAIKSISGQTTNPKLKEIFVKINSDIQAGKPLNESIAYYPRIFPVIAVSMIKVGETAGTLEKNLVFLGEYMKKKNELEKKIRGALFYPLIIMVLAFVEILGVVFFVLPQMESLFKGFKNIPQFTLSILAGTRFIRENIIIIVIVIAVIAFLISLFFKSRVGRNFLDWLALRFPIVNKLFISNILASMPRTLGILLESGIPLATAITTTYETVGNVEYAKALKNVAEKMSEGKKLSTMLMLYPRYFPVSFVKMIQIGEETGTLEDNLQYLNEFYTGEVNDISNNLTTLIEPIMLIFLGVIIALLAITIVGPIYQLTSSING